MVPPPGGGGPTAGREGGGWGVGFAASFATLALLGWGRIEAGGWAFPLDDTYIHLAVARSLAESGTWGVNPGEFASASSSPAWTAALGGLFALVGVREWLAVALNVVALVGVCLVADAWLARERVGRGYRFVGVGAVVVFAALPVVASLGMEHVPHLLVTLLLAERLLRERRGAETWALAALLPLLRYEGLFLVAAGGVVLLARRKPGDAVLLGVAGVAPVVAFGAWTHAMGAGFLPNGLVMKGALGTGYLANFQQNLRDGTAAFAVLGLVALLAALAPRHRAHGALLAMAGGLHLGLASVGWYYRYEAWLLAWGVLFAVLAAPEALARGRAAKVAIGATALAAVALAGLRTADAVRYFGGRVTYIRDAKVVLAESLARTAPGTVIALHDIGALALYGRAVVVDTAGLGTDAVAHLAHERRFTAETLATLVAGRGAVVGFATRSWMADDLPTGWEPVAELGWGLDAERQIEPLVAYAIRPEGAALARAWLQDAAANMNGRGSYRELGRGSR